MNENERLQDQVKSIAEEWNIYKQEQGDAVGRARDASNCLDDIYGEQNDDFTALQKRYAIVIEENKSLRGDHDEDVSRFEFIYSELLRAREKNRTQEVARLKPESLLESSRLERDELLAGNTILKENISALESNHDDLLYSSDQTKVELSHCKKQLIETKIEDAKTSQQIGADASSDKSGRK